MIIGTEPVAIGGLRIAGLPDPAASNSTAEVAPRSTLREEAFRAMELLSKEESPDIFAVHNPLMAEPFRGELPLILSGHTHKLSLIHIFSIKELPKGLLHRTIQQLIGAQEQSVTNLLSKKIELIKEIAHCVLEKEKISGETPVSYTHLDVYKRQAPARPF